MRGAVCKVCNDAFWGASYTRLRGLGRGKIFVDGIYLTINMLWHTSLSS